MSAYTMFWGVNEVTGRWNHSKTFEAPNDYEAIRYTVYFMGDEKVFRLDRTGYQGITLRNVIDCTDKVA